MATSAATATAAPPVNRLLPLLVLCSGTAVVLANQVVSTQAAIAPAAQMLTLVRYLFSCTLSGILLLRQQRPAGGRSSSSCPAQPRPTSAPPPRARRSRLLLLGLMDVSSYAVYNSGFALCGSALATVVLAASGQLATAALSATVLRRRLKLRHVAAVGVVTLGLVLRSMDDILAAVGVTSSSGSKPGSTSSDGSQLTGVACVMLSALLFSVLGILYEALMSQGNAPAADEATRNAVQAQASFVITGVSLAASLLHQLLVVRPRWRELVLLPLAGAAASGVSLRSVLTAHAVYGVITAGHQWLQLRVLAGHGAMALGLVNAVRASVVSFVSSALFCSSVPSLCLTPWRAASALVVSLGAAQWVLAGKPVTRAKPMAASKKGD